MSTERTAAVRALVHEIVAGTPVYDIHTHLYDPAFGGLLLWGIDELLTYHYLVAESLRWLPMPYEKFFAMPKAQQAEAIWQTLFIEHSPVSEALPVPDALLGLGAYLAEAALETVVLARGSHKARLALGVLVAGMALTALMLIGLQALVVGSWCSLCLGSAAISLTVAGLAAGDVRHVADVLRRRLVGCSATTRSG